jgi:AraC family transcriptional regulator
LGESISAMADKSILLMSEFPDVSTAGFDMEGYNQQFRERNVMISAASRNICYDRHWGPLSVKFVLNGEEYYQTDNSRYLVSSSNFLILNNNTEYSSFIDADEDVQSFTLNFSEKYVLTAMAGMMNHPQRLPDDPSVCTGAGINFIERTYPRDQGILMLLGKMKEMAKTFEERNEEISELFNELFYMLLLLNGKVQDEMQNIKAIKYSTREELYKRLNYARDYIECCFDLDIDLTKMASTACLNREYFIRQFKLYFGITPAQYLIRKRMEAAKHLLQGSGCSISEVCRRVGYSDLASFGKLFRKHYHSSPEEFRRMHMCNPGIRISC